MSNISYIFQLNLMDENMYLTNTLDEKETLTFNKFSINSFT
jgi:hypothetical protein